MIAGHGLADRFIFPYGTVDHYERVKAGDSNVEDYHQSFEARGVMHCGEGIGPFPCTAMDDLVQWVEEGIPPKTLMVMSSTDAEGNMRDRPPCAYLLVSKYKGRRSDSCIFIRMCSSRLHERE